MKKLTIPLLVIILTLAGCAKKVTESHQSPVDGEVDKSGTELAYEHTVSVAVAGSELAERMKSVQGACADERFGKCRLLRFDESRGRYASGIVTVRVEPAGVEPLVALASTNGTISSRETRAEDLSVVVADTSRQREQLAAQRIQLDEFRNRKDLAVADMIALAHEVVQVESNLADLDETSSGLQNRLDTNLLTLQFRASEKDSNWAHLGESISNSLDSFIDGTSEAIEMIAFGFPFLIILFPLALLWRWLWRRVTSSSTRQPTV